MCLSQLFIWNYLCIVSFFHSLRFIMFFFLFKLWIFWRKCWFWTQTRGLQHARLWLIPTSVSTTTRTTSPRPSRTTRALRAATWRFHSGKVRCCTTQQKLTSEERNAIFLQPFVFTPFVPSSSLDLRGDVQLRAAHLWRGRHGVMRPASCLDPGLQQYKTTLSMCISDTQILRHTCYQCLPTFY